MSDWRVGGLDEMGSELNPSRIQSLLEGSRIGKKICLFSECESTNDEARALAQNGEPEGTVIIAERQSKGRGRLQRRWFSPAGGLWFSVILRPGRCDSLGLLPLAVGLGVCEGLQCHLNGNPLGIKWPNDIVSVPDGKKLCGVLCECSELWVIAGIGINANLDPESLPEEIRTVSTSMKMLLGRAADRNAVMASVLTSLDRAYRLFVGGDRQELVRLISSKCVTLGKTVRVNDGQTVFAAEALKIELDGALRVRILGNGRSVNIYAGDVTLSHW
ncbi:MAG TPA: biotin--[acetyl-CoA-carboxylase] ligase [Firmicutes bacterium]|nr:biotin--[acetyl-CoA-carboxylase] ligase [Bacillota bacterium]